MFAFVYMNSWTASDQIWLGLVHLNCALVRVKFDLHMLNSVCVWQMFVYDAKSVRQFLPWKKKLHNEFAWSFVFPMASRLRNYLKCSKRVLGRLLYHEYKYLSSTKQSLKLVNSSQTCCTRLVHSPLFITITLKKLKSAWKSSCWHQRDNRTNKFFGRQC